MTLLFWIFRPALFILGFFLLIWGGNLLVNGAVALAKRMKVSPLLIGLTVVGFGTSTPELMASLLAVTKNSDGLAVGNVIGSNIANILLVLGVAACLLPLTVPKALLRRDSKFLLISTLILIGCVAWGQISTLIGLVMCGLLLYYVYYAYETDSRQQNLVVELHHPQKAEVTHKKPALWPCLLRTAVGVLITVFGAKILVDNAIMLARHVGVSEAVIGLTLIAVGTSLPELVTSIIASLKKQPDVAFGNIIGSNIYNALFILGFTAIFVPVDMPATLGKDIAWMTGATLLLLSVAYLRHKISRSMGLVFLVLYALYILSLGIK